MEEESKRRAEDIISGDERTGRLEIFFSLVYNLHLCLYFPYQVRPLPNPTVLHFTVWHIAWFWLDWFQSTVTKYLFL